MRKIIALILALFMCAAACAETIVNPITECGSLSELSEAAGLFIPHPAVMGVGGESFLLINAGEYTIGEYNFTVAGIAWTIRASQNTQEDISGVYIGAEPAYSENKGFKEGDGVMLYRWFNAEGQYVLMSSDENIAGREYFESIATEFVILTATDSDPFGLAGDYSDAWSQRAVMSIEAGDNGLNITVSWSNSAFEYVKWQMTGSFDGVSEIRYYDCVRSLVTVDSETVEEENGEGYFTLKDGRLLWDGASDESCRECTFERYTVVRCD